MIYTRSVKELGKKERVWGGWGKERDMVRNGFEDLSKQPFGSADLLFTKTTADLNFFPYILTFSLII